MKWVLIFAIYWGHVSSGSVEFDTLKACEAAAEELKKKDFGMVRTACVPRSL